MGFTTTATLTLKSIDDFHRVLEFVKPDESDMAPTIKKVALFFFPIRQPSHPVRNKKIPRMEERGGVFEQ